MSTDPFSRLYCLRHFHAARPLPGQRDFDRPLDARGQAQAQEIASKIISGAIRFSTVFVSPSVRTMETAALIGIAADDPRIVISPNLYEAPAEAYFDLLRGGAPDGSLIVGHNPGMEEFIFALCPNAGRNAELQARGLATGSFAGIDVTEGQGAFAAGSGQLTSLFMPPRP
ncbi:histidine phosphatase family protein [Aureimonas altamirensis]|uniref:SixA phosphatase family protein n=1 Tax=Aureimonas altamirensis TaxID=370622 RepID=UPI001E5A07FF|nr:histidine phosphatase family protein [Aureimonas altamirensis]UHD47609.1 histidine phosphatase family protein [Aureimonas altamirensis]